MMQYKFKIFSIENQSDVTIQNKYSWIMRHSNATYSATGTKTFSAPNYINKSNVNQYKISICSSVIGCSFLLFYWLFLQFAPFLAFFFSRATTFTVDVHIFAPDGIVLQFFWKALRNYSMLWCFKGVFSLHLNQMFYKNPYVSHCGNYCGNFE